MMKHLIKILNSVLVFLKPKNLIQYMESHHPTKIGLRLPELIAVAIFAGIYITIRFFVPTNEFVVAITGFVFALWAILRPTEWAVEGLRMLAERIGIGTYAAGVIGSLMANLPELLLAILLIIKGEQEIAVLTVLVAAGANTLLFGVVIIKNSIKSGHIRVPTTSLKYESELMIVAFLTALFLFVFNFAENIEGRIKSAGVKVPVLFSVGTVAIYIAYLIFISSDKTINPSYTKEEKNTIKQNPGLLWGNIVKFLLLGIIGIVIAGELLASGAETFIHSTEISGINLNEGQIALIVGFLGSIPEWAIAFQAGEDMELVFGNVLSSISAVLLLLIGLVSVFVHFYSGAFFLDPFAIVQFMLSGSILLFVNLLMSDDLKLDTFEGVCILILQLIGFEVLISV